MKKRIISIILVVFMILAFSNLSVFASNYESSPNKQIVKLIQSNSDDGDPFNG